jgi:low temperature requirement protein LtrA
LSVGDAAPQLQAQRSTPVELLWDLVFAFAITQVATLLAGDLSWPGFGRAMLTLALVWWAWSAFAWAANAEAEDSVALRAVLLPATAFIFVAGLAIPRAFSGEGTLFAVCYAVVRGLHLVLYADASGRGNASWRAIAGFAVTVVIGMGLLLVGSFATGLLRDGLWTAAVAIDYAGPAWLTRERLRGLQRVAVAHFAERYGLFVLICLGESIVSVGTGALSGTRGPRPLTAALVTGVGFALIIAITLWWVYFDRSAALAERRLREHDDPVLAAADAYSYLHLPIVAGIIVYAVGAKLLVHGASGGTLPIGDRLALCGGVALYLAGHLAFRLRLGEGRLPWRAVAILALAIVCAAGGGLSGWAFLAIVAAVMGGLCAAETLAGESPWPGRSPAPI